MKQLNITLVFLLFSVMAISQVYSGGVYYTYGEPNIDLSRTRSKLIIDLTNNVAYIHQSDTTYKRLFDISQGETSPAGDPGTGPKVYINTSTGEISRWNGSSWELLGSGGGGSGDMLKATYDPLGEETDAFAHSRVITGNPHNVTKLDIGLGNVDNTSDLNKPVSTATQSAINAIETIYTDDGTISEKRTVTTGGGTTKLVFNEGITDTNYNDNAISFKGVGANGGNWKLSLDGDKNGIIFNADKLFGFINSYFQMNADSLIFGADFFGTGNQFLLYGEGMEMWNLGSGYGKGLIYRGYGENSSNNYDRSADYSNLFYNSLCPVSWAVPQNKAGTPLGVYDNRYQGDIYVNRSNNKIYINPQFPFSSSDWYEIGNQASIDSIRDTIPMLFDSITVHRLEITANTAKVSFPGFTSLLSDYGFTDNSTNWNTAYSWGDHSTQGYLTTQTDDQIASEVNITDSGGNYDGVTVEAALNEIADSLAQHRTDINTGGGSGGTDKEYASFYHTTGGITAISNTEKILVIGNTSVNSNGSVFSLSSNQVTINKTGDFEISYDCYINNSSTGRTEYSTYLKKNGTEVPGTRSATYQRGYDSGMSNSMTIMLSVTSGDYFEIGIIRTDGGSTAGYQDNNGTRFNIKEL